MPFKLIMYKLGTMTHLVKWWKMLLKSIQENLTTRNSSENHHHNHQYIHLNIGVPLNHSLLTVNLITHYAIRCSHIHSICPKQHKIYPFPLLANSPAFLCTSSCLFCAPLPKNTFQALLSIIFTLVQHIIVKSLILLIIITINMTIIIYILFFYVWVCVWMCICQYENHSTLPHLLHPMYDFNHSLIPVIIGYL